MSTDSAKDTSRDERGPTPEPRDLEAERDALVVNVGGQIAQAIMYRMHELGAHSKHVQECMWTLYRAKTTEERDAAFANLEHQINLMSAAHGRELVGGTLETACNWIDGDELTKASMEATK